MCSTFRFNCLPMLLSLVVLGCGNADPCDELPADFPFLSEASCGRDTLTIDELVKIEKGELSVPGLPYTGIRAEPSDLPEIKIGTSKEAKTRDVCRACQSVCDCWIATRECFDTAAVNKSMPKWIELSWTLTGIECATNPGPPANHALACRAGQCVWEAVDPSTE